MSRKRKLMIGCGVLIGLLIVAGLLLHTMSGASNGTVQVGSATVTPVTAEPQPLTITTPYFSTTLPAGFSQKRQTTQPDSQTLLQIVAARHAPADGQFAATVISTPANGLPAIGQYNLRVTSPGTYVRFTPPDLPTGASAFKSITGSAEITIFWPHGNMVVSLSLTSDEQTQQQLESVFSQVITSWQWMK